MKLLMKLVNNEIAYDASRDSAKKLNFLQSNRFSTLEQIIRNIAVLKEGLK